MMPGVLGRVLVGAARSRWYGQVVGGRRDRGRAGRLDWFAGFVLRMWPGSS